MQNTNGDRPVKFREREFRGSRFRCLLATSLSQPKFVEWMNSVIRPFGEMRARDSYMPEGFCSPEEAQLGDTSKFPERRQAQGTH